jgi:tetratricopeptide (TPR) repeat protein
MTLPAHSTPYRRRGALCLIVCAISFAGCQSPPATEAGARLYPGFGTYHRRVTTASPQAQRWFDQGMQLLYGFNHDEAIRSFREASHLDPNCAMAWWGIAYASGLHINNPEMSEQQSEQAWDAALAALSRIDHASPVEQALIRAVAVRYAWPAPEDRRPLDEAYADAMQEVWRHFPDDPDVGALFAESLMNLQPWDLWTPLPEAEPKGRTLEIVAVLERVLEIRPDHPGANHFFIHAMEASQEPARALRSADLLTTLVPGSGHLVHMPAHIYARLGRWADASDSNVRAVAADRAYFKLAPPPEFYGLYFVHNLHFLAWSAMMEARYETALRAARDVEADIPAAFLREWPQFADGFMSVTYKVMIRFGRWHDILAEPEPPEFRRISRAMRHYARGVALSALGRTTEAQVELEAFEAAAMLIPDDWTVGNNSASDVVAIARHMLIGELAYREGRHADAFAALEKGVAMEDALAYDEPPGWMQPVRHALGALLMATGRYVEAEQVYRDDLARNRNNGWAMLGLEQSLLAQNRHEAAREFAGARTSAWARADVRPLSSCYCEPGGRR